MDTTAAYAAIEILDVLCVRDDSSDVFGVVCDPEMRATQREVTGAIEAIKSLNGVYNVTQSADGERVIIKVQFNQASAAQKAAVYEALAPQFVHGKAWGRVVRDDNGKHRTTFLRIDVPQRAAAGVIAKLSEVDDVAQFSTTNEYKEGRYITGIGFTMQEPTRDLQLNRIAVATVAEKLGIILADKHFAVEDHLVYASMPECNRENDPIDRDRSAA